MCSSVRRFSTHASIKAPSIGAGLHRNMVHVERRQMLAQTRPSTSPQHSSLQGFGQSYMAKPWDSRFTFETPNRVPASTASPSLLEATRPLASSTAMDAGEPCTQ
jgi:hypothetical protein